MDLQISLAAAFAAILVFGCVGDAQGKGENIFPNPGFDEFEGELPTGWTVDIWNKPLSRVKTNKLVPGRDGTGHCLEITPSTPMASVTLTTQAVRVSASQDYLFKGYYASACVGVTTDKKWMDAEGVSLTGNWLDAEDKKVDSFTIVLPDTQDRWVECFQEVRSPESAVTLQIAINRRWVGGRLRFDDFSLREGKIRDYEEEFSVRQVPDEDFFPIFGWLTPGTPPPHFRGDNGPDTMLDYYHAEFALANFTINLELNEYKGFGMKYRPLGQREDAELIAFDKDPNVWWFGGADEPSEKEFPHLAEQNQRIQRLAPSKDFWTNLFPSYADDFRAKLENYDHYISAYIDVVKPKILTYDHYCMVGNDPRVHADSWYSPNREGDYFPNLEIVRRRTLEADVEFGVIVSVGTFGPVRGASDAELRFQAYTCLAYGARSLGWFCYLTEIEYGNWQNWEDMVINRDGTRTRHYSMLKYLNGEVLALAPTLLRLKSTGVYHTDPLPPIAYPLKESELVESISGGMALVGEFKSEADGRNYIMVVNRDFIDPATLQLKFRRPPLNLLEVSKPNGTKQPVAGYLAKTGEVKLDLSGGDGRLFYLDE